MTSVDANTLLDTPPSELAHSMLGPSSAVRRLQCPASMSAELQHIELFGEDSSLYATEGTHAHKALELWLLKGKGACQDYLQKHFGSLWRDHMDNLVEAVEWVQDLQSKGYELSVEERYNLTHLHPACFGTADLTLINLKEKRINIGDFKYGVGVGVDADYGSFERVKEKSIIGVDANVQGLMYASGALKKLGLSDTDIMDWTLDITIIQPRYGDETIKTTQVSGFELVVAQDYIRMKFKELFEPGEKPFRLGSHCQFCSARPTCPAQHQRVLDAFQEMSLLSDEVRTMVEEKTTPTEKSPELEKTLKRLRHVYDLKSQCSKFFSQLDSFIMDCIQKGHGEVLGLELKPGRGRRAYPESVKTPYDLHNILTTLGVDVTLDDITRKDILPFTQVAKKIKKDERKVLEDILVQRPGSPKITPMRDQDTDLVFDFGSVEILD
jgi:hypothetical protein